MAVVKIIGDWRLSPCCLQCLDPLGPFPRVSSFEGVPHTHAAGLDTNHLLIAVLGPEICHAFRLFYPGVPDDDIGEHVASQLVSTVTLFEDFDNLLWGSGVDTVGFRCDRDRLPCRLDIFAALHLVLERRLFESRDGSFANVLFQA